MRWLGGRIGLCVGLGAWLVPLGYLVIRSGLVPPAFGYALVVGGTGYLLGIVVELVAPSADSVALVLGLLGGLSEIAFLAWLLVRGVRRPVPSVWLPSCRRLPSCLRPTP